MNGRRAGIKASQIVVNGTNRNKFMIRPDAFSAQDTLAQISDDKGIRLLQGLVIGHGVQIRFANTHLSGSPAQLTAVALAADDTGFGMFGDHQTHDVAAMTEDARGIGANGHVRGYRCNAGSYQAA